MNIYKNKSQWIFMIISMFLVLNLPIKSNAEELPLFAETAIAMEASTGEVLYEKNAGQKMYPASTTKLWTAYLVMKNIDDLDKVITVESDLSWVEPTSMYLKVGESFTVRELLEVMMLKSANDVAVLLAVEVSGSVEEFANLMNEEAKRLGCTNTNFVNPNGLPDENHYSTAYDMALIARECVKNEELLAITSKEKISLPANEFYPYERNYTNSNKFITGEGLMPYNGDFIDYKYDIVDGLKTGYTSVAGRCLLATAKVDDTRIITGVFNSKGNDVYTDSRMLIDYSIKNYKTKMILENKDVESELEKKMPFSKEGKVKGYLKESYTILENSNVSSVSRSKSVEDNYTYKVKMSKDIKLPIEKDDVIGEVEIYNNKEKIETLQIHALNNVNAIFDLEQIILLSIGIGLIVIITIRKMKRRIEAKKRSSENIYLKKKNEEKRDI